MKMALLNCNGFNDVTRQDVINLTKTQRPEVIGVLESKLREEQGDVCEIPGYSTVDIRRSDLAGDKKGGGILVFTREIDGLIFKHKKFTIKSKEKQFVQKERVWVTVQTKGYKTAYCFTYLGFQCEQTDKNGEWNDQIYEVIENEAKSLKEKGFRLVIAGDMNGWIGSKISGNDPRTNKNGERLVSFLERNEMFHLNGSTKTTGVWTRHSADSSSVLDYVLMEEQHKSSFKKMHIDEKGSLGGGSDHVWIILDILDEYVKTKPGKREKREVWKIDSTKNWGNFKKTVDNKLVKVESDDPKVFGKLLNEALFESVNEEIGTTFAGGCEKKRYPKQILGLMEMNKQMKAEWRELRSEVSRQPELVDKRIKMMRAEVDYRNQEEILAEEMKRFWVKERKETISKLAEGTIESGKLFWRFVKDNNRKPTLLRSVADVKTGAMVEGEKVKGVIEEFLRTLFEGSFSKVTGRAVEEGDLEEDNVEEGESDDEHVIIDLEKDITEKEVEDMVKELKNNKAVGVDRIPAEALKNSTPLMIKKLTKLFNLVKTAGTAPDCWKIGRVVLVFKKGEKTDLTNYRPLTVLPVVCGLYSRVMNQRLSQVVEERMLLGEIQQGFRKGRCGSDNTFILNTIMMKAGAKGQKVHLAFLDLMKAYDTVSRKVLWQKMIKMGFGGTFLRGLQALYEGDSVVTEINGKISKPVFLGRGLRQGCSLSPCLFALYMVEWGKELEDKKVGFKVGSVIISALFFADDVLLISRTPKGLNKLIQVSTRQCKMMRMRISTKKSQVISPMRDTWDLRNDEGNVVDSLEKVLSYKYLGVDSFNTMKRTSNFKQRKCITAARKYRGATKYLSRRGPDVVSLARCSWTCVAVPAVTFGTEFVMFSQGTFDSLEREQAMWAKETLNLPVYTPNVVSQVIMGVPCLQEVIWNKQIKAYKRLDALEDTRLAAQALWEHKYGGWVSPYISYISKVREQLGLLVLPASNKGVEEATRAFMMEKVNGKIDGLKDKPALKRLNELKTARTAIEGEDARWINRMWMGVSGVQLSEGEWESRCQEDGRKNSEFHAITECMSTVKARKETGILRYFNLNKMKGVKVKKAYRRFVSGLDENEDEISFEDYMRRGSSMKTVMSAKFGAT